MAATPVSLRARHDPHIPSNKPPYASSTLAPLAQMSPAPRTNATPTAMSGMSPAVQSRCGILLSTFPSLCSLSPRERARVRVPRTLLLAPSVLCRLHSRHQLAQHLTAGLMRVERGDESPLIHHR